MSILRQLSLNGVSYNELQGNPMQQVPTQWFADYQNIQAPPAIKQYLPQIAQAIYTYVASKANVNPVRRIHFNMLVSNGGGNPELQILTTFVANQVVMKMMEKYFTELNQAVPTCIEWVVDRRVNFIAMNDQNLLAHFQSNIRSIEASATEYVNEAAAVENFMANTYMGGTTGGFGNNGFNQQQNNIGGFGNQQQNSGFNNRGFGGPTMSGFGNYSGNNSANSVITRVDSSGGVISNENRLERDMGVQASLSRQEIKKPEPIKKNVQAEVVNNGAQAFDPRDFYDDNGNPKMELLPKTEEPWITNKYQPYPIAYDKRKFGVVRRALPALEGDQVYVIDQFVKVKDMDRSAHTLPTSEVFLSGVVPDRVGNVPVAKRSEFVEESLKKAGQDVINVREIKDEGQFIASLNELRSLNHVSFKEYLTSVDDALTYARYCALRWAGKEFGVYHAEFNLVKELVINSEDLKPILNLEKSTTFANLITKLRLILEDSEATQSLRNAAVQINSHLAQQLLYFIRFYLCINEYKNIESFVDDAIPLLDYIEEDFGKPYKENLINAQKRFIESSLKFGDVRECDVSVLSDDVDGPKETEEENSIVILPIFTPCILSCTEFLDSEYGLVAPVGLGAVFAPETTSQGLYSMVEGIVRNPKSMGLNQEIKRFFIATIDDRIYETNKGITEEAPLLITRFK